MGLAATEISVATKRNLRGADVRNGFDDSALVIRAAHGEVAAFEQLYRRHVARIHGLCRRLTGDPTRADELTQEVFVRAWEKLAFFRGQSAFGLWLHRIAVNVVLDEYRSRRRRTSWLAALGRIIKSRSDTASRHPGDRVDLEAAVARLPEGARTVFVLHDIEGYQHGEIAAMTGLAAGTCKAQLHRARRLLREELSQ